MISALCASSLTCAGRGVFIHLPRLGRRWTHFARRCSASRWHRERILTMAVYHLCGKRGERNSGSMIGRPHEVGPRTWPVQARTGHAIDANDGFPYSI
jgi:hypothetical protein